MDKPTKIPKRVPKTVDITAPEAEMCYLIVYKHLPRGEAYEKAFKKPGLKDSVKRANNILCYNKHVKLYFNQLKKAYEERELRYIAYRSHRSTKVDVINNIERIAKKAEDSDNLPIALKAQEAIGRALGMFLPPAAQNNTTINNNTLNVTDKESLAKELEALRKERIDLLKARGKSPDALCLPTTVVETSSTECHVSTSSVKAQEQ